MESFVSDLLLEQLEGNSVIILAAFIQLFISIIATRITTKYTLNHPQRITVLEQQFTKVYLPLYLLSKQYLDSFDASVYPLFIQKATKLFYNNYAYVYPKTLKLFNTFKEDVQNDSLNPNHLTNLYYQIDSDYNKLKKALKYPTDTLLDRFKRTNTFDKTVIFIKILFSFLAIVFMFLMILSMATNQLFYSFYYGIFTIIFIITTFWFSKHSKI